MNETEQLVQRTLRKVFADDTIVYDKSHFAGGLTNYNYIMTIHGKGYVIREPGIMTDRMLNRPVEQVNNVIASELGVNSVCVYFSQTSGIKISEYIENGKTFAALDPSSSDCVRAVAALLKTIHASPKVFPNTFDWKAELQKYERIVQDQKGQLFSDYPYLKNALLHFMEQHISSFESIPCHNDTVPENFERIVQDQKGQLFSDYPYLKNALLHFMEQHISSFESIPCHNDTVPENFLMNTATGRPYLIDWEYSGMNDPTWDIAAYIGESRLTRHAIDELFSYYYGANGPTQEELLKIKCFIMAQDLLWFVWAVIRHYGGEDFLDYCYNRYNRFRRNLKALTRDTAFSVAEMVKW